MKRILRHLQGTWRNHFSLQLSTVVVVTFSFVFFILMSLTAIQTSKLLNLWGAHQELVVYIDDEKIETAETLKEQILKIQLVEKVEIIDQNKNLNQFKTHLENYASALKIDEELASLLPVSLKVQLQDNVENPVESLNLISNQIQKLEMVSEVSYGQAWIQKYESFFSVAKVILGTLGILFFSSLLLVFMNVIRASIDSRKKEIEVLEMIGASKWMIRSPFVIEGGVIAFICGSSAMIISYGIYFAMTNQLRNLVFLKSIMGQITFFDFQSILIVLAALVSMGLLSAWLCVRKINTFLIRPDSSRSFVESQGV